MLLAERETKPELPTSPGAMVLAPPASHRPQPHRSSGVARELTAAVPNSAADPSDERSGPPTPGSTDHHDATAAKIPPRSDHHDAGRDDPSADRSEPRTQRSGVSVGEPPECDSGSASARPFKVDEVAPEFHEQALVLWRDENWNSAQLFREFTKRYGQHAVGRSSFYRWVEERLVEGRAPEPLACKSRLEGGPPDGPNPRDVVDLDADAPEFQSRVMLDLALRLPRGEIEALAARLTPLRSAGNITLPESALLRAVRARQSYDRAMERAALFWVI